MFSSLDWLISTWSLILHLLLKMFYKSHDGLWLFSGVFALLQQYFYHKIFARYFYYQHPLFKMSSIEAPSTPVLEVDADLVGWALTVLVSTPDFMRIVFSRSDIVEETTDFWGWIKLNKSCECSCPDLHLSVWTIYSSKVLTTLRLLSWVFFLVSWLCLTFSPTLKVNESQYKQCEVTPHF